MNTAARLEQSAGEGEVLVGEATWRLVHRFVELEAVTPLQLKGKAGPVPAWRLVSIASSADAGRGSDAPLVGRVTELERLRCAFENVLACQECRLVTVMGSPGVGKTRLVSELATALSDRANVVIARCEPTDEGPTFLPVAEVLRVVAGIGEADPPELVREKLGTLVLEEDPDRERLIERIAGVLGIGEAASAQETFWALRRGIEFLALRRPLVLVLDDLHWAQPMLLDLVEHLVEWVREAPLLILVLARPELRDTRASLAFAGRRASDVIELEPLDERESRELVSGILGDAPAPASLSARILDTTEGNPLFLRETVRMLLDEGVLRREGDAWITTGDLATVDVPPTIHAVLAARIERLASDERSVIERAAVIGRHFYRGAVADLVASSVGVGIDAHLEALRRKDLVQLDGTYWIDEPVYRFHHVLLRDAAYRSILKEARSELHERFAGWLEAKAGKLVGEHEEVIAFHLEQAHGYRCELGPLDEAGRALGARAVKRLHSAGRRALAREDLAAAANLLGRALACHAGDDVEVLWDLCEAVLSAGATSTAVELMRRFAGGGDQDRRQRARATVLDGQLANLTGAADVAATVERMTVAVAELGALGDRMGVAKGCQVKAAAYARLGRVALAEEALDQALAAARAAGDRRRTTAVLASAPRAALWGPSPVVRASGRCLDVVRILRMTPGNRHVEAIALRCQAVLEAMRGRAGAAREILAAGRGTLEQLGLSFELHETAVHAGIVELLDGDPKAAAEQLRAAREGFEMLGVASGAAQAAALLAQALVELGDADAEALEQTRFAEEHGGEDLKTTITWTSARAWALARTGDIDQALELAHRAVSLAEPTDALADKADASIALARVLLAAERYAASRDAARRAGAWYEAKGHTVGAEWATKLTAAQPGQPGQPDHDDRDGIVARYAELPRRPTERAATAAALSAFLPERFLATYIELYNARDVDRLLAVYAEDWVMVDHRKVGWDRARGRSRDALSSEFASAPDIRLDVDEVLACDDRVLAGRVAHRGTGTDGAGQFELRFGIVIVVEFGCWISTDVYEPDDDAAMLARYVELGGGLSVLGDRAPERWLARFARVNAERDRDALPDLYTNDYEFVDHRSDGWEPRTGRERMAETVSSIWEGARTLHMEVDEVVACDDRVIAARIVWRGTVADDLGGGDWSFPLGVVVVVDSDRAARFEQYEPSDTAAMLARYADLGKRWAPALGDRKPERFLAEYIRRTALRDIDGALELCDEDFVLIDHRPLGWEPVHGRGSLGQILEHSIPKQPHVEIEVDEVLACDERVVALVYSWRGHGVKAGEIEYTIGLVCLVHNGRWVSCDVYEPEAREAMLARFAELNLRGRRGSRRTAGGGGRAA